MLLVIDSQKEVAAAIVESDAEQQTTYDEFERTVIEQSMKQGFSTFEIVVSIREDCLLKAARVYMVFGVLEELGEIIKSTPPVEQLEEEKFDHQFSITFVTKVTSAEIEQKVMKVSEVEKVEVTPIRLNDLDHDAQTRTQESKKLRIDINRKCDCSKRKSNQ